MKVDIDADQAHFIPANVGAQIRATTAFGAKYVDLIYPDDPSTQRLSAGAVLLSRNVTTEVNTVFENLVGLLDQIDPAKLNAVLGALSEGFRGQGSASDRPSPTRIKFCWQSIRAVRRFARTGAH